MQDVASAELCPARSSWRRVVHGVLAVITHRYHWFVGEERTEASVFAELCKQDESEIL